MPKVILFTVITALTLTACGDQSIMDPAQSGAENVDQADVVASVNGVPLSQDVIDLFIQQRANANRAALSEEQVQELVNQVVNFELLAQDALDKNLHEQSPVAEQLQVDRMETLAAASIRDYFDQHPVTEEMMQAEYQRTLAEMDGLEYNARHILVDTEEQAQELIGQLQSGEDFNALARRSSIEPGAEKRAGDLGWFTAEQMVKPFADAIREMQPGDISSTPVKTQFGWHVIELRETRDAPMPTFEDLRQRLDFQIKNAQIEGYVNMLRGAADISMPAKSTG